MPSVADLDAGRRLADKHVVLGVGGGPATDTAAGVLRRLVEDGATVTVVADPDALRYVTRLSFETLSGRPLLCGAGDVAAAGDVARRAHALVLCPATPAVLG